jgi:serpin B
MTLVLPDRSDPASLTTWLRAGGLTAALRDLRPRAVNLTMPTWTFRSRLQLKPLLAALGMPTAFGGSADFSGITRDVALSIDDVYHQGFVAVDEEGTEAAAATAVVMREVSAPADPLTVTLDRPFLFVVHDVASRAPLFVGWVADPTR